MTEVLAAMSEVEREQLLRLIDGPPRQQRRERVLEFRPLPSARSGGVRVRVTVKDA
ncbi:hypothetical protein RB628_38610 [Streptomyces sp. ADMS]|uniref:hypothetical protein n=1 Tax=Streptomyces sp. ADMS TaxID=3071415 RepID=UPI00296EDFAB|nr:hypothetical protein [Streptomyces sp. ADMS]MDW4911071.1 hypothetical protein [Streptomyces sp. ADMS]